MTRRGNDASLVQDAAPMEQVRELLFGTQLKEMEVRFRRQEERFLREVSDARESLKKRLDSLENFMKSETSMLLHRLQEEQTERSEAIKAEQRERSEAVKTEQRERVEAFAQLGRDLAAATESLERKVSKLSSTLDATERELRQLLLSESGSLTDKIEGKYQDALQVIAKTASQIRDDMVYRSSLSGMFTECALKLSGQWAPDMDRVYVPVSGSNSNSSLEREVNDHDNDGSQ